MPFLNFHDRKEPAGVDVGYDRNTKAVSASGWYNNFQGIEPAYMPLKDFLKGIGVRKADLDRVLKEWHVKEGE